MSLPMKAIDRLFERLGATYGKQWTSMWDGTPISDVKSLWAHELATYSGHLEALAFALENLPPRAPNCIEFKQLCRMAPRKDDAPAIEHVKADPARVAAEFAKLREVIKAKPAASYDSKEWARIITARHDAGEKIRPLNLRFAREALGVAA
jgi:hypothetical protein